MSSQKCDSGKSPQGNPYITCNTNACSSVNPFIHDYVPEIVPADHSGKGLFGLQSNFIGPYTHATSFTCSGVKQTSVEGDNWGGGSQWFGLAGTNNQIYPFPIYYYTRFLGAIHGDVDPYKSFDKNSNFADCSPQDFVNAFNKSDKQALITEINKINTNIIKPAVQFAIDTTNQALKELQNDNLIDKSLQPLTLDKILYQEKDKLWGIPPSAASAKTLYTYYYTLSDSERAQQQKQFSEKIKNCKVGTNKSLANMSVESTFNLNLVDIAKAWIISFVGDANDKNLQEQRLIDCPATLIITSGETTCGICSLQTLNNNTPEVGKICCENQDNGGIWQITSPDSPAISYASDGCNEKTLNQNICCNADYVNTHLYTNDAYKVSSFGMFPGDAPIGQCSPCQTGKYPNCKDPICPKTLMDIKQTNSSTKNNKIIFIILITVGILLLLFASGIFVINKEINLGIIVCFILSIVFFISSWVIHKNNSSGPTPPGPTPPGPTPPGPTPPGPTPPGPTPPGPTPPGPTPPGPGNNCKKGYTFCKDNNQCVKCSEPGPNPPPPPPPKPGPLLKDWDYAYFYSGTRTNVPELDSSPYTKNNQKRQLLK